MVDIARCMDFTGFYLFFPIYLIFPIKFVKIGVYSGFWLSFLTLSLLISITTNSLLLWLSKRLPFHTFIRYE